VRSSQTQGSRYRSTRTDTWFFSFLLGVGVSWDKLRASDKPTSFFYIMKGYMNIFYLDKRPDDAAEMHCDKHCVKMVLEYAQMLSTAHRILDEDNAHPDLYKIAHKNHPSTIWTRSSKQHYDWLFRLFRMLSAEYSIRYGLINDSRDTFKVHKSWEKLGKILETAPKNIKDNGWEDPPQCMPDDCKDDDVVRAYRNYYIQEKKSFAKWNYTMKPKWMLN